MLGLGTTTVVRSKNDPKIGFFLYFEKKLVFIFAGNMFKWKLILLSILLYKSHICRNLCSWVLAEKAFNQLGCRIVRSHISPDGMTGSHWFFACRQIVRREKNSTKFSIGCDAQRLLKSCSLSENSIEWKGKWKEETFHAFLIYNLS